MTEEEAHDAPEVVIGKYLINGATALVLFDSGATRSYISTKFVSQNSLPMTIRSRPIVTSSPLGDPRCIFECKGVRIMIQGMPFMADLTLLKSEGIDVILGMDWCCRDDQSDRTQWEPGGVVADAVVPPMCGS